MEIRPTSPSDIGDRLKGVLADLDAAVDKTPAVPITVKTSEEFVAVTARLKADKDFNALVESKLKPFSDLAFRIHRTITGAGNMLRSYGEARITYSDRALVAYDDEKAREKAESEENLRKQAAAEDEERKKEEAAALTKRGEPERAAQVLAEPPRAVHVEVTKATPKVAGFGFKERYVGYCEDEDQLIRGVARGDIYREIAAWLRADFGAKAEKLAKEIDRKADTFPAIPASIFMSTQGAKDSLKTAITKVANATGGKIKWPGVVIEPEKKTTTRR